MMCREKRTTGDARLPSLAMRAEEKKVEWARITKNDNRDAFSRPDIRAVCDSAAVAEFDGFYKIWKSRANKSEEETRAVLEARGFRKVGDYRWVKE